MSYAPVTRDRSVRMKAETVAMRPSSAALLSAELAVVSMLVSVSAARPSQQPVFREGTTLVEVSAVMTSKGETVTDLKPVEVQVFDNGVKQPLVEFEFVDLQSAVGAAQRRDFVLMLDDLHVQPRQTMAVQEVANAFVEMLGPYDRLAIVNTSPHELVMQLSTDREQARSLIKKFRGQSGSIGTAYSVAEAGRIQLEVLGNVASGMIGTASERRAVLLVSEGNPMQLLGDGRLNQPDTRIRDDFLSVLRLAALANIAVYGVNPTGLEARSAPIATSYVDSANAAAAQAEAAMVAEGQTLRRHGSVGQLAASTGGLMTVDRNALTANLPQVLQDSRRYYRLVYVQPDVEPGERGKVRQIEVRVLRPRIDVRARRVYLPN